MSKFIEYILNKQVSVFMFYLALVLMGSISLTKIEWNLLPDLELPRLTIVTLYPNASPDEVENLVTKKIYDSIGTISGIKKIHSESIEGISFVTMQLNWDVDVDNSIIEIRERVDLVRGQLPHEVKRPIISRFDPSSKPFMEMVFVSKNPDSSRDLRFKIKNEVKDLLDRIDGVALVEITGGHKNEIQIKLDSFLLQTHKINIRDIERFVSENNINIPAGHITIKDKDILIRILGEYRHTRDLNKVVIGRGKMGQPIHLENVGTIVSDYKERKGMANYQGEETVIVSLRKEPGKNTVTTSSEVQDELIEIRNKYQKEFDFFVIYDESDFIKESIWNIIFSLLLGAVLAFCSLFFILRNFKSPLVLVSVVPVSVLTTVLMMYIKDVSINLMSLGGISLGIGMLFDSGNVVLSAIERNRMSIENNRIIRKEPIEAAIAGVAEVSSSVINTGITTIIVFLPIIFIKSIFGVVFRDMALTITFSLFISMVLSLTLIPLLSSLNFKKFQINNHIISRIYSYSEKTEDRIRKYYLDKIKYIINNRKKVITLTGSLFALSIVLLMFVEKEYIPAVQTGEFTIHLELKRGSSLQATQKYAAIMEKKILAHTDVQHVISKIGFDEDEILSFQGGNVGTHKADIRVILKKTDSNEVIEYLRTNIKFSNDIKVRYESSGDAISKIFSNDSEPIVIELSGDDVEGLRELGFEIQDRIQNIQGIVDVHTSMGELSPEFHVVFDQERMSELNFTKVELAEYLNNAIRGLVVSNLRYKEDEINIRMQFRDEDRNTLDKIKRLTIPAQDGKMYFLSQLASIERKAGFSTINKTGSVRVNKISANVSDVSKQDVLDDVSQILTDFKLPSGYSVKTSGEQEQIKSSFNELFFMFILAIILIFLLLTSEFTSMRVSLSVILIIPVVLIGVAPLLLVNFKSINVSSITGFILLAGIVVDGSILFYEYVHMYLHKGAEFIDAIINASQDVLRPVIMNALTTILAMLPIAMELGSGTEFQSPMAITIIGGLLASIFITLILVPIIIISIGRGVFD